MREKEHRKLLTCSELSSGYDGSIVIKNMSFGIDRGQVHAVVGKNGMGKSTLLKTIMGFVRPLRGKVLYSGIDVTGMQTYRLARHGVAYVPQEAAIFQDLTVEDNLRLVISHDRKLPQALEKVEAYFPILPSRRKQLAGTLSGGEQKMLLMSRALISDPTLIMMDEVSEGLQPTMLERISEVVTTLSEKYGVTVLLVEQNVRFVGNVADRATVIKRGQLLAERPLDKRHNNEATLTEMMWA